MDSGIILPGAAALSVALLCVGKLYFKIRSKFPVEVNCWFCCSNSTVPYNSSNSWYCPDCDQYNGFSSDGSYNRLLPEQFSEKMNCGSWCSKAKPTIGASNGLCQFCNINLQLKVQQLAQFVPLNKENYDEEVEQYSDQLERVYRLCQRCQGVLEKTLTVKQYKFVTNQPQPFSRLQLPNNYPVKEKERHSVFLVLTALLSACLLLSVMPYQWATQLLINYPPPDYVVHLLSSAQPYLHKGVSSFAVLIIGIVVQLFDCVHMRDTSSVVNLLLWVLLLSLTRVPVQVEGIVSIIHMLASIVFFITSVTERKQGRPISVAAVKPVQLQKLDGKSEKPQREVTMAEVDSINKSIISSPLKSPVSDPSPIEISPIQPVPFPSHESSFPEDLGFGKLNVSSRRVTRSQTKPFQPKQYTSQTQPDLFRPKPFNLSPPKLQIDRTSDYQVPLTRSSSQSSGFVSLSHQRDFEEYRSASTIADEIDSASQCGRVLAPYQSPFVSPTSFSHHYGVPFTNFQPYAIMHFSPPNFNKFYEHSNLTPHQPSLNWSTYSSLNQSNEQRGWFLYLKRSLSSMLLLFLVTSNVAILWKVFGEEYFKFKT